jgi:hypothetical protein
MGPAVESRTAKMRSVLLGGVAALLGLALSFARSGANVEAGAVGSANLTAARCGPQGLPPQIAKLRKQIESEGMHKVSVDPRSPDYDPVKLAILGKNGVDLYEAEPRQDPWASDIEGLLRPLAEERLKDVPGAKVVEIDCRTSSCAVTAEAPAESEFELQVELQAAPYAQHENFKAERTENGMVRFGIIGLIRKDKRDPAAFAENIKRTRSLAEGRKALRMAEIKAHREESAREPTPIRPK